MNDTKRRQELAQFLRTRREQLSPEALGVSTGSRRRTPGLRREELSQLAGMGVTWYTRLEQGKDIIVSPQILESLARVFDLNAAERHHLFVLAREEVPTEPYPLANTISPQLQGSSRHDQFSCLCHQSALGYCGLESGDELRLFRLCCVRNGRAKCSTLPVYQSVAANHVA